MNYDIIATDIFTQWLSKLKDRRAAKAIAMRLVRAEAGNLGDFKSVGNGVSEMRIFVGKGYRLYFTLRDGRIIILLNGGNKASQFKDIQRAKYLLAALELSHGKDSII